MPAHCGSRSTGDPEITTAQDPLDAESPPISHPSDIAMMNSLPNPISTTINLNKIPFKPKDQSITMTTSTPATTLTSINNHHHSSNHHHHHRPSNHHLHHRPSNHHLHHQTQSQSHSHHHQTQPNPATS
ncbi:hypothetical protein DFH28DRAFT_1122947 [Melampsora americana]|nr:hypothetical protein DFH28DRAFT_1122947 [Melampsora americana]